MRHMFQDRNRLIQFPISNWGEDMEAKTFGEIVPQKKKFDVEKKVTFGDLVDRSFVVLDYETFPLGLDNQRRQDSARERRQTQLRRC